MTVKQLLIGIAIYTAAATAVFAQYSNYISFNQIGYATNDTKIALIQTSNDLENQYFYIVDYRASNNIQFSNSIPWTRNNWGIRYPYLFAGDFSAFSEEGMYRVRLQDGSMSAPFTIGAYQAYSNVIDAMLDFYQAQRCGDAQPYIHGICHTNDRHAVIDAEGGWHDAGDYIKFVITTSFTVLELMLAYDYAVTYGYAAVLQDSDPANGIPDILDQTRIGLEWLLKMTENGYYYQVGVEADHSVWRLPEGDDISPPPGVSLPRVVHSGFGANLIGRTTGALAIAARSYNSYDASFADACLNRAGTLFADRTNYYYCQHSRPSNFYFEESFKDDLTVGAVELYLTTGSNIYQSIADGYVQQIEAEQWFTWDAIHPIAFAECYRAGIQQVHCKKHMIRDLSDFKSISDNGGFYLGTSTTWGTFTLAMCTAQLAIMYELITGSDYYYSASLAQRDYLLGRNQWGVCFITDVGQHSPLHPAHPTADILGTVYRGAVVGGPVSRTQWEMWLPAQFRALALADDAYAKFQERMVWFDHKEDYVCNEPAIDYNAPSMFCFIYYLSKMSRSENKAPFIEIHTPPGCITGNSITLSAAVYDDVLVWGAEYQVDATNGAWMPLAKTNTSLYHAVLNSTALSNGMHYVYVRAWDNEGLYATNVNAVIISNNQIPHIQVINPTNGAQLNGAVPFIVRATDDGTVYSVAYRIETNAWQLMHCASNAVYTNTWDSSSFTNKLYTLSFRAMDTELLSATSILHIIISNSTALPPAAAVPSFFDSIHATEIWNNTPDFTKGEVLHFVSEKTGTINISIFDINGRHIYSLPPIHGPGYITWDGMTDSGILEPGLYFVVFTIGDAGNNDTRIVKKLLVL